jgi:hypothetical protein
VTLRSDGGGPTHNMTVSGLGDGRGRLSAMASVGARTHATLWWGWTRRGGRWRCSTTSPTTDPAIPICIGRASWPCDCLRRFQPAPGRGGATGVLLTIRRFTYEFPVLTCCAGLTLCCARSRSCRPSHGLGRGWTACWLPPRRLLPASVIAVGRLAVDGRLLALHGSSVLSGRHSRADRPWAVPSATMGAAAPPGGGPEARLAEHRTAGARRSAAGKSAPVDLAQPFAWPSQHAQLSGLVAEGVFRPLRARAGRAPHETSAQLPAASPQRCRGSYQETA